MRVAEKNTMVRKWENFMGDLAGSERESRRSITRPPVVARCVVPRWRADQSTNRRLE